MVSAPDAGGIYAVAVVLGVISIVAIALRYAARRSLAQRTNATAWKSDDWLVFITVLLLWGLAIILIYGASVGTIGTHTQVNLQTGAVIPTWRENQISMFGAISQILSVLALGALKAGVVLFYRRVFAGTFFRKFSLAVLILVGIWTLAFLLATVLQCKGRNLDLMWLSLKTFITVCYEYKTIQLAHCVTDVATDLIVLALPLQEIWRLHMETRQKTMLSLIFLVGLLSLAAGLARLVIVATDIVETTAGARDVRGVETNALVWTFVEIGVAIVAACLPTYGTMANRRGLESAIASVRSMVSLSSTGSGNSRTASVSDSKVNKRDDIELRPYVGPDVDPTETQVSRGDSTHKLPGHQAIRREDSVTVSRENIG